MTSFCKAETLGVDGLATSVHGRGEGAGTRFMEDTQTWNWCRRCAVIVLSVVGLACGSESSPSPQQKIPDVVKPTKPVAELPAENASHVYYRGLLADVLGGDTKTAAAHYRDVLDHGAEEPAIAAEAALRLAGWSEENRQRRDAMDLAFRAAVLGVDIPRIKTEADALRLRLATTLRAQDLEVRGPRAGTQLINVSDEIAQQFADAEVLLATYHRRRLKPRLEALAASVRGKRSAMERAVRAYREVASSEVPEAMAAAEFRIASLYYDFSLSLSFELPPELDPIVARKMRSELRSELRFVRGKARVSYQRSLGSAHGEEAARWIDAAKVGLSSVEDVISLVK